MHSTNILMLQTVANGLGELKNEIVFVGGAVAELHISSLATRNSLRLIKIILFYKKQSLLLRTLNSGDYQGIQSVRQPPQDFK